MRGPEMMQHVTRDPNRGCEHLFVYKGIRCSQSPLVLSALDHLTDQCQTNPARTIVEIGTLYGAFTQLVRDHDISKDAVIHTFDIRRHYDQLVPNVNHHLGDCFTSQLNHIIDLIKRPGRCFVFCDGGDKEREIQTFCAYLKPDDLILCHDYAKDPSLVNTEANGFWPGYESQYANIKDVLNQFGCVPFQEPEMQRAVWGCFRKRP